MFLWFGGEPEQGAQLTWNRMFLGLFAVHRDQVAEWNISHVTAGRLLSCFSFLSEPRDTYVTCWPLTRPIRVIYGCPDLVFIQQKT